MDCSDNKYECYVCHAIYDLQGRVLSPGNENRGFCAYHDCNKILHTDNVISMECVKCGKLFCETHALIGDDGYICCENCNTSVNEN